MGTWPAENSCGAGTTPCNVSAKLAFVGVKARLMLPIPYFGPFFEAGVGGSFGRIHTRSGSAVDRSGGPFMHHFPLTIGVALGRRNQHHLAFSYLFHPRQDHVVGGIVLGLAI